MNFGKKPKLSPQAGRIQLRVAIVKALQSGVDDDDVVEIVNTALADWALVQFVEGGKEVL